MSKIKIFLISFCLVIAYLLVQPYIFVFLSGAYNPNPNRININIGRYAITTSIFSFQKSYSLLAMINICKTFELYDAGAIYVRKLRALYPENSYYAELEFEMYMMSKKYFSALQVAKTDPRLKRKLIEVYLSMKDIKNSRIMLAEYKKGQNKRFTDYFEARIECLEGNYEKADLFVTRFLKNNPDNRRGWGLKAQIAKKLGNKAEAEKCLKQLDLLLPNAK